MKRTVYAPPGSSSGLAATGFRAGRRSGFKPAVDFVGLETQFPSDAVMRQPVVADHLPKGCMRDPEIGHDVFFR